MPTKMARRDYNESLPGFVTSQTEINPTPGKTQQRGGAMLRCFREEEEKTRGARKNIFIWIRILSSNDSNGFTSFKINVLKQRFSILFLASPCSASLSLSLSLSHSDHQLSESIYLKLTEAVAFTNNRVSKSMRQQQTNIPLRAVLAQVLHDPLH